MGNKTIARGLRQILFALRVTRSKQACVVGVIALLTLATAALSACGGGPKSKQSNQFFTSGSREADQRASQRMAKAEQLAGSGEGAGEKEKKGSGSGEAQGKAPGKLSLFERLGGQPGITAIVDDFTPRALQDPRVNWDRKGIKTGGLFRKSRPQMWDPTVANVAALKKHIVQFLSLATGGPARYEGKEMTSAHAGMKISNPEFDAAVGDLKASLDKLKIANQEQKELLAIIESTRPQIVTER